MPDPVSTLISIVALTVSATTAWLTFFRRGTIRATRPTVIYFGPDSGEGAHPKVYLRTLLFATSRRGRVVESMHVTLARNETKQTFNVWVVGDDRLTRGSGLFVGETGVSANHHFLPPLDGTDFKFNDGAYQLQLVAKLVGDSKAITLISQRLDVTPDKAAVLRGAGVGLYFDWGPDSGTYIAHTRRTLPPQPVDPLAGIALPKSAPGHP